MARESQLRGWPKDGEPPYTVAFVDEEYVFTADELAKMVEIFRRHEPVTYFDGEHA